MAGAHPHLKQMNTSDLGKYISVNSKLASYFTISTARTIFDVAMMSHTYLAGPITTIHSFADMATSLEREALLLN